MKATTANKIEYADKPLFPYPNAATRRQVCQKILDFLVMAASGIGVGAVLLFMLANA